MVTGIAICGAITAEPLQPGMENVPKGLTASDFTRIGSKLLFLTVTVRTTGCEFGVEVPKLIVLGVADNTAVFGAMFLVVPQPTSNAKR
jgi:hypothetical protein